MRKPCSTGTQTNPKSEANRVCAVNIFMTVLLCFSRVTKKRRLHGTDSGTGCLSPNIELCRPSAHFVLPRGSGAPAFLPSAADVPASSSSAADGYRSPLDPLGKIESWRQRLRICIGYLGWSSDGLAAFLGVGVSWLFGPNGCGCGPVPFASRLRDSLSISCVWSAKRTFS